MLLATVSKFIIDLEDIQCPLDPTIEREDKGDQSNAEIKREKKKYVVTLSGLLNLIDGIWLACGQEKKKLQSNSISPGESYTKSRQKNAIGLIGDMLEQFILEKGKKVTQSLNRNQ
ncbi:unnamed protein product [Eruca vesicaria subsp. sativa]|uniref:Uncharacterized protein n=1 Tax=Eruca vesicaria subsp. sativa TaxID=29727 RepID=A0ABC8M263_ERUVS|nr:unnamed protein product [Eruca vesicaria subsp. sativa]